MSIIIIIIFTFLLFYSLFLIIFINFLYSMLLYIFVHKIKKINSEHSIVPVRKSICECAIICDCSCTEQSHFIFQASIVLKSLILLFVHLISLCCSVLFQARPIDSLNRTSYNKRRAKWLGVFQLSETELKPRTRVCCHFLDGDAQKDPEISLGKRINRYAARKPHLDVIQGCLPLLAPLRQHRYRMQTWQVRSSHSTIIPTRF